MLTIRRMEERDLTAVSAVERVTFSQPWSEQGFRDALKMPNTFYLIAEENGILAGYAGMVFVLDEGEITNVATAVLFRRKGIAEQILYRLFEEGRKLGVENFTLEVRRSNVAARNLYLKLGFKEEGIRKNFYEKPIEDAILMWKRF